MKQPLKQSVRRHFGAIELNAAQLAALQSRSSIERQSKPARRRMPWSAAALVTLVLVGAVVGDRVVDHRRTEGLLTRIAAEVAENHLKLKPLDVEGGNLTEVLGFFDGLDFRPLDRPRLGRSDDEVLLGGRYCSIQGITAAQLRLRSRFGEIVTVYQGTLPEAEIARVPDFHAGESPATRTLRGLRVSIWREDGVVFARAEPAR